LFAISCFSMADGAPLSANLLARLYDAPAGGAAATRAGWQAWLVDIGRSLDQER